MNGKNKYLLLLIVFLLVAGSFSFTGCGKISSPVENHIALRSGNIKNFSDVDIKKFIPFQNLNCYIKSVHSDWKYDTQVISAFENTIVYAIGSGKVVHPPTGLVYIDHLVIYDSYKNSIVKLMPTLDLYNSGIQA